MIGAVDHRSRYFGMPGLALDRRLEDREVGFSPDV
jgi:hypothetical protein